MSNVLKKMLVGGAIVVACMMSGNSWGMEEKDFPPLGDGKREENVLYKTFAKEKMDELASKINGLANYLQKNRAHQENLELKCVGVCRIEVNADVLLFDIKNTKEVGIVGFDKDSNTWKVLAPEAMCTVSAKGATQTKITLKSVTPSGGVPAERYGLYLDEWKRRLSVNGKAEDSGIAAVGTLNKGQEMKIIPFLTDKDGKVLSQGAEIEGHFTDFLQSGTIDFGATFVVDVEVVPCDTPNGIVPPAPKTE